MSTSLGWILGASDAEMNAQFEDYANLGVRWLRVDFWWNLAQPTKSGGYNWTKIDKVVAAAESHGIDIVGILNVTGSGKQSWVDASFASSTTRADFAAFAKAAAAHFGDRVDHWEILNEPNMKGITPWNYGQLLKGAYTAIHSVSDGDTVITGGLAATPTTTSSAVAAVDYLKGIYAAGAGGYFDAVGYHPYSWPLMPADSKVWNGWQIMEDGIRGTMVANGDSDLQVWMTEFGAPTAGSDKAVSQAVQAAMLSQAYALAQAEKWVGPLMWFNYEDGMSPGSTANWFGLLDSDGNRKAAYYTYKSIGRAESWGADVSGTSGADALTGDSRKNTIWGHAGSDAITGKGGDDILWGGAGADRFVYDDTAIGVDRIKDFSAGDKIDLSGIDANTSVAGDQAFHFIGRAWLDEAQDLGFYRDVRGRTSIQGDVNGDGKYDFNIQLDGHYDFSASDFLL